MDGTGPGTGELKGIVAGALFLRECVFMLQIGRAGQVIYPCLRREQTGQRAGRGWGLGGCVGAPGDGPGGLHLEVSVLVGLAAAPLEIEILRG